MEKTKVAIENPVEKELNPLEDLIEDLDEILADFEENLPPVKKFEETAPKEGDYLDKGYQAMIGTFVEIMQNALKPITRYIKAIRLGNHARELFELIDFSISPLIPKVKEVELTEVASRMESLRESVTKLSHRESDVIERKEVRLLCKQYKPLHDTLHLEYRGNRKAVANILKFYKLMREDELLTANDIKRFFAIGVPSITAIRKTSAQDLSSLSGLPIEKSRKIKNIANWFRELRYSETVQSMNLF
jgi:hypothetical protein